LLRVRLGGFIVQYLFGAVGELKVAALEPDLEKLLLETLRLSAGSGVFAIEPGLAMELRAAAALLAGRLGALAAIAGLVTRAELREALADLLRSVRPRIWVFAFDEIPAAKQIKVVELLGRAPPSHG
jgi:flagellar biosynthesis protein FlhA